MVHPGGRPRYTSPDSETCIALGEDLVKWAEDFSTFKCRFCDWYTQKWMIRKEWEALLRIPEFRIYYERARCLLGQRLLDGTVNPSMAHRISWHYVPESKEQEIKKMEKEAELKRKSENYMNQVTVSQSDYENLLMEKKALEEKLKKHESVNE